MIFFSTIFFFIRKIEIFWEKCAFLVKIQLNLLISWKILLTFLYHNTENKTSVMILNMLLHVIRELVYESLSIKFYKA
jgi:hypothetical protein